jgi:primosomal protein DnaI
VKHEGADYLAAFTGLIKDCEADKSVYLYGNMGTGKTYLAAAACNDHARRKERVAFIHYPSFCARMAGSVIENAYKAELDRLKYVKFLVIDDIGAENVTEWNRDSILLPLLNERSSEGLPTWFTSNCDLATLKVHFTFSSKGAEDELKAERIMERIETMCRIQPLTGADRRK